MSAGLQATVADLTDIVSVLEPDGVVEFRGSYRQAAQNLLLHLPVADDARGTALQQVNSRLL